MMLSNDSLHSMLILQIIVIFYNISTTSLNRAFKNIELPFSLEISVSPGPCFLSCSLRPFLSVCITVSADGPGNQDNIKLV